MDAWGFIALAFGLTALSVLGAMVMMIATRKRLRRSLAELAALEQQGDHG